MLAATTNPLLGKKKRSTPTIPTTTRNNHNSQPTTVDGDRPDADDPDRDETDGHNPNGDEEEVDREVVSKAEARVHEAEEIEEDSTEIESPRPQGQVRFILEKSIPRFRRSIRLYLKYRHNEGTNEEYIPKLYIPSDWDPPFALENFTIEQALENMENMLRENAKKLPRNRRHNLSPAQRTCISAFAKKGMTLSSTQPTKISAHALQNANVI